MRSIHACVVLAVASLAGVAIVLAGPLDPPAGPIASTYKTLNDIEPRTAVIVTPTSGDANSVYRIAAPGSYYLTGNFFGVSGRHGIKIEADNVTLDLNGFTMQGVPATMDGISVPANRRNIVIKNGNVREFWNSGIFARNVSGCIIRDVIVQNNGGDGIWVGSETIVQNVQAIGNGARGFVISERTQVSFETCQAVNNSMGFDGHDSSALSFVNCSARNNPGRGFWVGGECRFTNCQAIGNGVAGYSADLRSQLSNCTAEFNAGVGFVLGQGAKVNNCRAANNTQDGFSLGSFCHISSSVALQNTISGITANSNSSIIDCEVTLTTGTGIAVANGATVDRCSVTNNTGVGIFAADGCMIRACTTFFSGLDGIRVNAACSVIDNNLQGDGSAPGPQGGIRIEGGVGNRIEGNNMVGCDNSIFTATAAAQGNFIARNTSRSPVSSHFNIVASNSFGPIVTVTGAGNFGGVANSNHPMANFVY